MNKWIIKPITGKHLYKLLCNPDDDKDGYLYNAIRSVLIRQHPKLHPSKLHQERYYQNYYNSDSPEFGTHEQKIFRQRLSNKEFEMLVESINARIIQSVRWYDSDIVPFFVMVLDRIDIIINELKYLEE